MRKLPELNARRAEYFAEVQAGLAAIPGLRAMTVYEGVERGGYYGFPVIHDPEAMGGLPTADYVERLRARGVRASLSPYPNLHDLPLFAKGFDIFTHNRGPLCASEGYTGYKQGDFPKAELALKRTVFLPVLSDPVPGAAQTILQVLNEAARDAG